MLGDVSRDVGLYVIVSEPLISSDEEVEYDNVVPRSSSLDEVDNNEVLPVDDNDVFVIKSSLLDNGGVLLDGVWFVVSKLPFVVSDAEVPTNSSKTST